MLRILFIINPISGIRNKSKVVSAIVNYLDNSQFDYQIQYTEYPGHAEKLAAKAVEERIDIVVAVGGDGTVNEVAKALIQTQTALAIIPHGSGNGLARHLKIPLSVKEAVKLINTHYIRKIDFGQINERPFFCTCGLGFDATLALNFSSAPKRGFLSYVKQALKTVSHYSADTYLVADVSGNHRYKAFIVACANASQYGNNAFIAPTASVTDGMIDIVIIEPFKLIEAPLLAMQLYTKTLYRNSHVHTFRTKSVHIERIQEGVAHYDGEVLISGAQIDVVVKQQGLNVIVNPSLREFAKSS